jgi:hypothetical protein
MNLRTEHLPPATRDDRRRERALEHDAYPTCSTSARRGSSAGRTGTAADGTGSFHPDASATTCMQPKGVASVSAPDRLECVTDVALSDEQTEVALDGQKVKAQTCMVPTMRKR